MKRYSPNEAFDAFRGEVRRVTADLAGYTARAIDPIRKIGRDGFRSKSEFWTLPAEQLSKLQNFKGALFIARDIDWTGIAAVLDGNGRYLATATLRRVLQAGATDEHAREAHKIKSRYRRATKTALAGRDFLLANGSEQIIRTKHAFAVAREAERRAAEAPNPPPAVTIARADLVPDAQRQRADAERQKAIASAGARPPLEGPGIVERLAQAGECVDPPARVLAPKYGEFAALHVAGDDDGGQTQADYGRNAETIADAADAPQPDYSRWSEAV